MGFLPARGRKSTSQTDLGLVLYSGKGLLLLTLCKTSVPTISKSYAALKAVSGRTTQTPVTAFILDALQGIDIRKVEPSRLSTPKGLTRFPASFFRLFIKQHSTLGSGFTEISWVASYRKGFRAKARVHNLFLHKYRWQLRDRHDSHNNIFTRLAGSKFRRAPSWLVPSLPGIGCIYAVCIKMAYILTRRNDWCSWIFVFRIVVSSKPLEHIGSSVETETTLDH